MGNAAAVDNDHTRRPYGPYPRAFLYDNACVLVQPNANCARLGCNCLYQASKPSSRIKMRINHHTLQKAQAYTELDLSLQVGPVFRASGDHGIAHGGSTGA